MVSRLNSKIDSGIVFFSLIGVIIMAQQSFAGSGFSDTIKLPSPGRDGGISIEKALWKRRSIREYANNPLTIEELSQLLWAAQGITSRDRLRTAPSAGALYPLELYVVVGAVSSLTAGVYKFKPHQHALIQVSRGDKRLKLSAAALNQSCIANGAVVIVLSAVYERVTGKYGQRGVRYTHVELGHASQNIYLQATALNLGTVEVGAFDDKAVTKTVGMSHEERPLALMPVGRIKE